jgi:hypothetical protein
LSEPTDPISIRHFDVIRNNNSRNTEQDLKDILAFYKSPIGRKMLLVEPRVIDSSLIPAADIPDSCRI